MQLGLLGGLTLALVLLYYTAKKNGKLEEQNRQKSAFLNAQAEDLRTLEAQMFRWDEWRQKVDARLKGINVATISDGDLQLLWKDPVSESEATVTAKLEEIKPTK